MICMGIETLLKIYAMTLAGFFWTEKEDRWSRIADFTVVWGSLIIEFLLYGYFKYGKLVIVMRFWRVIRII